VLIPGLLDSRFVVLDDRADAIQFPRSEPIVAGQHDRVKPELAFHPIPLRVHVHGLVAIEAVEE
jgi:hypothetical protein